MAFPVVRSAALDDDSGASASCSETAKSQCATPSQGPEILHAVCRHGKWHEGPSFLSCSLDYPAVRLLKELGPAELQTMLLFLASKSAYVLLGLLSLYLVVHYPYLWSHIFSLPSRHPKRDVENLSAKRARPDPADLRWSLSGGYSQQFCREGGIFSLRKQVTGGKPLAHAPCFTSCYPNPPRMNHSGDPGWHRFGGASAG